MAAFRLANRLLLPSAAVEGRVGERRALERVPLPWPPRSSLAGRGNRELAGKRSSGAHGVAALPFSLRGEGIESWLIRDQAAPTEWPPHRSACGARDNAGRLRFTIDGDGGSANITDLCLRKRSFVPGNRLRRLGRTTTRSGSDSSCSARGRSPSIRRQGTWLPEGSCPRPSGPSRT